MDGPGETAIVSGPSPRWGAVSGGELALFNQTPYNDLPSSPPPKYLPAATATIITVQAAAPPPKAARETAAAVPRAVAPEAGDCAGLALGEAGWHGRDGCDGEAGGCERCEKNGG
ncbi:hypothetical protein A9K55_003573 [Cordyceps militaris]|uniref:Uncharacterized protein n=1 Tax=Cordyceps militaris TaxID=73501 RepID=A0A2H4S6K1_CORMI|nr:hypothetical protein A9K55_003573 [Cordyceps militaris]